MKRQVGSFAVSAAELALMLMPFQSFAAKEQNKINANDVLGSNNGGASLFQNYLITRA